MHYILDCCLASILYLGVTCIFFYRRKTIPDTRTRLYSTLLALGFASLVLDVLAAAIDPYAASFPTALVYFINILFLLCVQASGPVFFLYALILTGAFPQMPKWGRGAICIPFTAVLFLLLLSPFGDWGIFYLTAQNGYQSGALHSVLYIAMFVYLLSAVLVVFLFRRRMSKSKCYTIYGFIFITLSAMILQFLKPMLLVNTTANAIALTMMYYVLQSPNERIDPLTDVFSATALPVFLQDRYEQGDTFTLYVFFLHPMSVINRTLGTKMADRLLVQFAAYLQKAFAGCNVIRIKGSAFAVLDTRRTTPATHEDLLQIRENIPREWWMDQHLSTQIFISVAAVNSTDCETLADFNAALDFIQYESSRSGSDPVLLADSAFQSRAVYRTDVEGALEDALNNDGIQVYYQPIHRADGSIAALEALCRITHSRLGPLPPDLFIRIAEEKGSIHRLGDQMSKKICRFIQLNNVEAWGLDHIGVNLSSLQCMQDDLIERILRVTEQCAIRPGLLSFEITETELISSLPAVRQNMERLLECGFSFLLDDFGSGFANFNYIASLPFSCIKIDKLLLWSAMKDDRQLALLSGIADVLGHLGLPSVVEGVETREQAALVQSLGFTMQQGYYYAKALPPQELIPYVEENIRRYPRQETEVRV